MKNPTFQKSLSWLVHVGTYAIKNSDIENQIKTCIGLWICESVIGHRSSQARKLLYNTCKNINDQYIQDEPSLMDCDAKLLLFAHKIFNRYDLESAYLSSFSQKIKSALECLPEYRKIKIEESILTLSSSDLCIEQYLSSKSILGEPISLLASARAEILHACKILSAACEFGRIKPSICKEMTSNFILILTAIMIHAFRRYDLELGITTFRTLQYLDIDEPHVRKDAVRFILAQQRADGRFGYMSTEASTLKALAPDKDEITTIYLPLNILCLWSLAEFHHHGFLLFHTDRN